MRIKQVSIDILCFLILGLAVFFCQRLCMGLGGGFLWRPFRFYRMSVRMPGRDVHFYQFDRSDSNLYLPFVPYSLQIPEGREGHRHCLSLPGRLEHLPPFGYFRLRYHDIQSGCQQLVNPKKCALRSGYGFIRLLAGCPFRQIAR